MNNADLIEKLGNDIARLTAERDALREAHRWIPSSDRMPDKRGCYLFMTTLSNQPTVNYYDPEWNTVGATTHWMPLPEPPTLEVKP